jgi:3-deoxy-D-manno-octulosonic-acid transferase
VTLLVFYQLLYPVVALAALAKVAAAGRWGAFREGAGDAAERLGRPAWASKARPVWVHAASVGEVRGMAPVIARLAPAPVVVTCSTAAGRAEARATPGVAAAFLAPADLWPCAASFLSRLRPSALLVAESELWPLTLVLARGRKVPTALVNACLSERSGRRWLWGRTLAAAALGGVRRAAYQTPEDRARFEALGVSVEAGAVCGNPKHDLPTPSPEATAAAKKRVAELFGSAPCWTAGSTRPGEEELVLEAHRAAAAKVPGLRLILAPRHPERSGDVAALLRKAGVPFARWSEPLPFSAQPVVLLVDAMGALPGLYPAGLAAFVGGTLLEGSGGHNVVEPAAAGVPVLFGPHTEAVAVESAALEQAQGGRRVADAAALGEAVAAWALDPAARATAARRAGEAAASFTGAGQRVFEWVAPVLDLN